MRTLAVELHGSAIGTLYETNGRYGLAFDERYVEAARPPVLSLSFMSIRGRPLAPKHTTPRMIPFFANLLPEPNSPLRKYLSAQAGVHERDDMGLLRALSADLPGAVKLRSNDVWETPSQYAHHPQPAARPLRFSLAGVQMKFSVRREENGFVVPTDGVGGTHILKLPDAGKPELAENEASMMRFAAECGIDAPPVQLVSSNTVSGLPERFADFHDSAYVVERFDRSLRGPIHMEDFAQIMRVYPEDKYERNSFDNIMRICSNAMGDEALAELVRRLVFTIAIGNADMHLKNWSVRYQTPSMPTLSPAYDYVCTAAYPGYDDFLALPLAKTSHWGSIGRQTFLKAARSARVSPHVVDNAMTDMIGRIREVWPRVRDTVPDAAQSIIERQLQIPLFQ